MQKIKDFWQNLQSGTKKLLIIIVSLTVIGTAAAIIALKVAEESNYSVLFTELNNGYLKGLMPSQPKLLRALVLLCIFF